MWKNIGNFILNNKAGCVAAMCLANGAAAGWFDKTGMAVASVGTAFMIWLIVMMRDAFK